MRFGDIRRILDKATEECIDCHDEDCHYDCSYYVAKLIKEEILDLFDKEQVQTDSINSIPCKLYFKGICKVLPVDAKDGDTYVIQENHLENGCAWRTDNTFYWYDNKWNYLSNPPENCKIKYV